MRILVAEADSSLADLLRTRLQQEHFLIQPVTTADQIANISSKTTFELILLDLNVPGFNGPNYLRLLQDRWPEVPVVVLSAGNTVEERIRGLDAGADDFMGKPFAVAELMARIRSVLRRRNRPAREIFQFDDLEVNRVTHEVRRAGRLIELSPKEYALLDYLLRNPGRPVTRASIIEDVWRIHGDTLTNVVDVYINYLRRKIDSGSDRPLIRTIRCIGYQVGGLHSS